MIAFRDFSDRQLARFQELQRTSYAVLSEVASGLEAGSTERDATQAAMKAFRREGADRYFHLPVALFGDRTTLPGTWTTESFWPTDRALAPGDAVILDASPAFDGYVVDTSISFSLGDNPAHARAKTDDLAYRTSILEAVRSGATLREIADSVDSSMQAAGDRNCHQLHPEGVLGHRVVQIIDPSAVPPPDDSGFDSTILRWFIAGITKAHTDGVAAPTWNSQSTSDYPPPPGLWAVEPHLARGDIGVKWEELLVIEPSGDAHWLDDQVPHLS